MKKYLRLSTHLNRIDFEIDIIINYIQSFDFDIAASIELDSMDTSSLDTIILSIPKTDPIDTRSDAYVKFIELVNKIDELLELRQFDVLGETETQKSDSESTYRGIVLNVSKDQSDGTHIFGKIMHTLRISGHPETRSSRRYRADKLEDRASQPDARNYSYGDALEVGDFDSIVVRCKVSSQEEARIPNKEFYSYLDVIKYVDQILDMWSD